MVEINDSKLIQIDCKKSKKTLGVMMGPALTWDYQFVMIVNKMKEVIGKLKNAVVMVSTASMYYNMYLYKKVYFGSRVLSLNQKQEDILKKIYEPVILKKMGLSEKFPRLMLYSRKTALGVGLMSPNTIISTLALKLYLGHNRSKSELSKVININEENARLFYGYSGHVLNMELENKPKVVTWSDEIQQMLCSRELKIVNRTNERKWMSKNKTIMDYAIKYVNEKELDYGIVEAINHVRIFKQMILPYELVGFCGNKETKEAREVYERSSVIWKVKFKAVRKPHKRLIDEWKEFVKWLKEQHIETIVDFSLNVNTKYEVTNDYKYVKKITSNEVCFYEKTEARYGRNKYERIEAISVNG